MHASRGIAFVPVLLVIALIIALGGGAYIAVTHPSAPASESNARTTAHMQIAPGDHPEIDHPANEGVAAESKISWKISYLGKFNDAPEVDPNGLANSPLTSVTAIVNGTEYFVTRAESEHCVEVTASKELLAGELAAVRCPNAQGGEEIGVFAHEDGGYQIMVGALGKSNAGEIIRYSDTFHVFTDIKP